MNIKLKIPQNYKVLTNKSSCLFTISVGYEDIDGEELNSIFKVLNKTFSSCTISVCDTLQKYNLFAQQNLDIIQAEKKSLLFGENWLKKNQLIFNTLTIPYKIIRWTEWLSEPSYLEKENYINELYENDSGFKNAVLRTIEEYVQRLIKRKDQNEFDKHNLIEYSIKYLKEEAAVMLVQTEKGYNFELYIKKRNEALKYLYQTVIFKNSGILMVPIYIKS